MTRREIMNQIHELALDRGLTAQELTALILKSAGVESIKEASEAQLAAVLDKLRASAEDNKVTVDITKKPPKADLKQLEISGAVVPVISVAQAIEHFQRFQKLKAAVLTDADYLFVGKDGRPCRKEEKVAEYIKKSGWRKIALLFNLSIEIDATNGFRGTDNDGPWHGIVATVRVIAPNGRFVEAEGSCTTRNAFFCKRWDADKKTYRWIDTDESNLLKTAQTVAINRAISDLVGSGELSAEEVE